MTRIHAIISSIMLAAVSLPPVMRADTVAEQPDTLSLGEVQVTAAKRTKDVIPVQVLSGEDLERLNSQTVADALRYFS